MRRAEAYALAQAWALLVAARPLLRAVPFTRLLARLRAPASPRRGWRGSGAVPTMHRLARIVETAARFVPGQPTSLHRVLVLAWLLRRHGITTTLRLGVSPHDGGLTAHAWLEREGRPVPGLAEGDGYEPLLSIGIGTASR
jgi:hypothetical protein